jgi:hypothetical protein
VRKAVHLSHLAPPPSTPLATSLTTSPTSSRTTSLTTTHTTTYQNGSFVVTVRLCLTGVQEVLPYWRVLDLHRCRCVACLVNKVLNCVPIQHHIVWFGSVCVVWQVGVAVRTLAQALSRGLPPCSRCTPTLTSRHWWVCLAAEVGVACG